VGQNKVDWVEGKDKIVKWKGSKVTVIEVGSDGKKVYIPLYEKPEGLLKLGKDMSLYIVEGQCIVA
jgi:hypothetical protein